MAAEPARIIGTKDAAEILHWNRRKVQRAANTGQIPIVGTVGAQGEYLFDAAVIEKLASEENV